MRKIICSSWIANLLLITISLLLALSLGEAIVRLFHIAPPIHRIKTGKKEFPYIRSSNKILGYEMIPNYQRPSSLTKFLGGWGFSTNSHGMRDTERALFKPLKTKRIILLGDSIVAGQWIWNLEDTISMKMERMLKHKKIEVLNFGMGGYNTRGEAELKG